MLFIASPTPLPPCFVSFSLPFLSLTLELKLYSIFSPYSQIVDRYILRIAIMGGMVVVTSDSYHGSPGSLLRSSQHKTLYSHFFTISLASIFSSALSTYVLVSPCCAFYVYPCNVFEYLHPSSPSATTASHFVHSLVEQLMPGKCISAVLWHNPIIQSSMHQISTFMSFHSTIVHGEPHGNFTYYPTLPLTLFPHILP